MVKAEPRIGNRLTDTIADRVRSALEPHIGVLAITEETIETIVGEVLGDPSTFALVSLSRLVEDLDGARSTNYRRAEHYVKTLGIPVAGTERGKVVFLESDVDGICDPVDYTLEAQD